MPSYIVKASPDEDYYVMWSTVVDAPTFAGTRAEMETCHYLTPQDVAPERFARADQYGTSAQWGADEPGQEIIRPYGWDTAECVYQGEDAYALLPRDRLREFCDRLGRDEPVDDLLVPTEDDNPGPFTIPEVHP